MTPIAQRLLLAKNDARVGGKVAVRARISAQDARELRSWVKQQNRPHMTGIPTPQFNDKRLWDMDIIEDGRVRNTLILEFEK